MANVTAKELRPIIVTNINRASPIMTDESVVYPKIGKEFGNHHTVNHSANEYARLGSYVHINTAENFFSMLKRGIVGNLSFGQRGAFASLFERIRFQIFQPFRPWH